MQPILNEPIVKIKVFCEGMSEEEIGELGKRVAQDKIDVCHDRTAMSPDGYCYNADYKCCFCGHLAHAQYCLGDGRMVYVCGTCIWVGKHLIRRHIE